MACLRSWISVKIFNLQLKVTYVSYFIHDSVFMRTRGQKKLKEPGYSRWRRAFATLGARWLDRSRLWRAIRCGFEIILRTNCNTFITHDNMIGFLVSVGEVRQNQIDKESCRLSCFCWRSAPKYSVSILLSVKALIRCSLRTSKGRRLNYTSFVISK